MSTTAVVPSQPSPSDTGHRHLVEFYETDAGLAGAVARFLAPAMAGPGAALVVATPAHRAAFEEALSASGVDVAGAIAAGRYVSFDAGELLATFLVDGVPDRASFEREVGAVVERMSAEGRPLRVYGEMVALLWDGGDPASAVALEDLWNEMSSSYDFELLCAYRLAAFDNEHDALAFRRVCEQHASRPEQVLIGELAYADAVATVLNRRAATVDPAAGTVSRRSEVDSLILSTWRNASQLMVSPGGRVLGYIVAAEVSQAPFGAEADTLV
jgi:hypothetical protein